MKVTTLDEKSIRDIGHAFGYYDYGEETGMSAAFSGKEATANYICAYVRGVLRGGFLHTTGERCEGYIAYKLPKEKMGLKTMWPIACGMLHNSTLRRLLQFGIAIKRGGVSLQEQMTNATGETTVLPTAISEQQPASDETTPETSVPEPEQMQPTEALPDYEPAQASGELDVDLTTLSSTMVYSEIYNMMYEPDRYVGKRIKMNGQFAVYGNPNTGAVYTACIIMDATACCSQGLEFVLEGEHSYPADYPELGTEITVVGTFQTYEENGYMDCHLVDAKMTE